MAHHDDDEKLPSTWPFRAAGVMLIAAILWFVLGMGLHDVGEELPNLVPIFWGILLVGLVFLIAGAIYNTALERGRTAKK
jgi:drug/metabolite transporter (DMT)-like permease